MNLGFTPKFHVLREHIPNLLFTLNDVYDIFKDVIER